MSRKLTQITFSPGGTTASVADLFCQEFSQDKTTIEFLTQKPNGEIEFNPEELLVVAMPVFAGRLPQIARGMLRHYKGKKTPAVAMVVYGNRDYDDALLELCDILKENGFSVIGAGAFVARHSIFPRVAESRPDGNDKKSIRDFAVQCSKKIEKKAFKDDFPLGFRGKRPYMEASPLPLKPKGNASCNRCNTCVKICPTAAISEKNPRKTDKNACISCTACIYHCPRKARNFSGIMYGAAGKMFQEKCGPRLSPEWYA